jgi:acyl-CoA hydrolase
MYTEVIQDAVIELMKQGNLTFVSGCSLTVSPSVLKEIYSDLAFFKPKMILRLRSVQII